VNDINWVSGERYAEHINVTWIIHTGSDNKVREFATVQKPQYGLMTLAYQRFTALLLLIYSSLFLSVFWCAVANYS
jgi:hypothetical protein